MANLLDILSSLGQVNKGYMSAEKSQAQTQELKTKMALQAIAMQNQQQQQQGMNVAGDAFSQLPQRPPMAPMPGGGPDQLLGGGGGMPQPQQSGGGMAGGLPPPGGGPLMAPNLAGSGVNWQGENPLFKQNVSNLLQAAPPDVREASGVDSGFRTNQQQAEIYDRSGQGTKFMAAPPGKSLHEQGLAADWTFKTPEASTWVHENAKKFGLDFPLGDRDPNHMQLAADVLQKMPKMVGGGVPVPAVKASSQVAIDAGTSVPTQQWGSSSIDDIKAAINKVAPDAPGVVKLIAAGQLSKLLMPEEKMQMQMYFKDKQQQMQLALKEMQITSSQAGQAETHRHNVAIEGIAGDRLAQSAEAPGRAALNKFLEEKPDASAEEIQSFIQRGRSARSGPAMAAQKYLQENPNASAEDIRNFVAQTAAQTSTVRQFDVGKQGDTVRSLNVAIDHLAVLSDAGQALGSGDVQKLNQLNNYISKELGQPAVTDFNSVKAIVKDELVKAVLGGVGALGDRQEVEKTIDAASSPQQLQGVIKRYEQLMGGQMKGLKQQFITSGGGDESDFDKKLLPRTREAIKRAGSPAEQSSSATDWSKLSDEELIKRAREAQ